MKDFFKVNWRAINAALDQLPGHPDRSEFYSQWNKLNAKIKEKRDEAWNRDHEREKIKKEQDLRALPVGSIVFYSRNNSDLFGLSGIKVKDNRKYMSVDFSNGQAWKIDYQSLTTIEPTESEIETAKGIRELAKRTFSK
jgi:hypothetical protein